jgi:hypothetical protein
MCLYQSLYSIRNIAALFLARMIYADFLYVKVPLFRKRGSTPVLLYTVYCSAWSKEQLLIHLSLTTAQAAPVIKSNVCKDSL